MTSLTPLPAPVIALSASRAGYLKSSELENFGVNRSRIPRLIADGQLERVVRGLLIVKAGAEISRERVGPIQFERQKIAYFGALAAGPTAAAAGSSCLIIIGAHGMPNIPKSEISTKTGGATTRDHLYRNRREPYDKAFIKNGVKVVSPELALAQAVLDLPRNNAVSVMESLLNKKLLTPDTLSDSKAMLAGRHGANKVITWWNLIDQRSQSPAETFLRLLCTDLGCPPDALQLEVRDSDGWLIARVDMAWRLPGGIWLLGEVDGFDFHSNRDDLRRDRDRQNLLVSPKTILRRCSGTDAMNGRFAADVEALLKSKNWRPGQVSPYEAKTLIL